MSPVIELRDVSFNYREAPVLEHIDLSVDEREFLGIVGPNAGGKSTLLKLILGLLRPRQGEIRVLGGTPAETRHQLGYVAQHPGFARDFPISVRQVVELGLLGRGPRGGRLAALLPARPGADERARVRQAMREVEVDGLAERQIGSLSGGQLQRVLLARALVARPRILLLDEPTANVDQRAESEIFDLLRRLNERMTILVVSHDIAFVSSYVSRVACVNRTLICHPTAAIDAGLIQELYGEHVRMVAHDHPHGH